MTRVLFIHQAFVSPEEAGGTRHYELARRALKKEIRFTIVASDLSYLTGQRARKSRTLIEEEDLDGIRVLRVFTYASLHRSFLWRVVSFCSFMFTSLLAAMKAGPIDLVMGTSPPIFQTLTACLVAAIRRRPFLLEIRDLWPEFAIDMGVLRNPILKKLSRWLERFLYACADHLLVNSPAYKDYLLARGISESRITLVANGVDPEMFISHADGQDFRSEMRLEKQFVATYAGALGMANDIPVILRAASRLREHKEIHFLLVGDGKERGQLESQARDLQLTNVTFVGTRPKSQMPEILAASNACIATLQNIPMFSTTYPNKVFDYMAAARPTILAIDGVIRKVIEEARAGIFVHPGDDAALSEAVLALSKSPALGQRLGEAGRAYVSERFNRDEQATRFTALLERLVINDKPRVKAFSYRLAGKRLIDLLLAGSALVLLSPLLFLLGLLVRIKLGSPVLFRQQRPGFLGRPFTLLKFRTMTNAHDANGEMLADEVRLTPFGRFMRSASLDELPELLNVLSGKLSLVGPRPLLLEYLDRYTTEQARRHNVKPGITGWAQVNGRNTLSWQEKFAMDVWYVDHCSFWLDLKICLLTISKVIQREGISEQGQATMTNFTDNAQPLEDPSEQAHC
jgi:lipopolysaccharide/colanic/teichoic acid biosynthesis glycosyltransferase